jgi:hypothetical protein
MSHILSSHVRGYERIHLVRFKLALDTHPHITYPSSHPSFPLSHSSHAYMNTDAHVCRCHARGVITLNHTHTHTHTHTHIQGDIKARDIDRGLEALETEIQV